MVVPERPRMTPTQRTLNLLRSWGWTPGMVERWIPGAFVRRDLFNIIDIIATTGQDIVGVQSCGEAYSDHYKKLTVEYQADTHRWLSSGGRLFLIGWRPVKVKRGGVAKRYEARTLELFLFDLEESMRTPKKKVEELLRRKRSWEQIRAVAVARDDKPLLDYLKTLNLEGLV